MLFDLQHKASTVRFIRIGSQRCSRGTGDPCWHDGSRPDGVSLLNIQIIMPQGTQMFSATARKDSCLLYPGISQYSTCSFELIVYPNSRWWYTSIRSLSVISHTDDRYEIWQRAILASRGCEDRTNFIGNDGGVRYRLADFKKLNGAAVPVLRSSTSWITTQEAQYNQVRCQLKLRPSM